MRGVRWCIRIAGAVNGEVLLTDGAFTAPGNCLMREYGAVLHIPRLFDTKRAAALYVATNYGTSGRYVPAPYTWASKPWEREGSIIKVAVDLGHEWYYGPRSDTRART